MLSWNWVLCNVNDQILKLENEIRNKVAESGIITIDLEQYYVPGERVVLDMKPILFQEMILREKDLRDYINNNDWSIYKDKLVALQCSADAVIPTWAYMLISMALQPFAKKIFFGTLAEMEAELFSESLSKLDLSLYKNARVVIKGCGDIHVPVNAYVQLSTLLKPIAKSIMYGEPCSTVPLYKAPK